jgi:hypothetical protein
MDDSIRRLTAEHLLEVLLFEVGNLLVTSVGLSEIAKEMLDSSHPALSPITNALQAAERARTIMQQVGEEWRRRKIASSADH